jgi:CRP-like cAMP-binding protein
MINNMSIILALLNNIELFSSLPEDLRIEMAGSASERLLKTGDTLIYAGDPSTRLFLLLEGQIDLMWDQQTHESITAGALVDPAAALGGQAHRVRAVAMSACRLISWPTDTLHHPAFVNASRLALGEELRAAHTRLADVTAPIHFDLDTAISPGPFLFESASILFVFCEADPEVIKAVLPEGLTLLALPGRANAPVFLTFADFPNAHPENDDSARFGYTETSVFVPVSYGTAPGVHIPYIYPSAWEAILIGREVYGFPKQLGHTILGAQDASLSVDGAPHLHLRYAGSRQSSETQLVGALMSWLGLERHLASAAFQIGDLARSAVGLPAYRRVDVFCHKRIPAVNSIAAAPRYDVDQLTHAVFGVQRWHQVAKLTDPRLTVIDGPLVDARLTLLEAYQTRLDMRLSTGRIERDFLHPN